MFTYICIQLHMNVNMMNTKLKSSQKKPKISGFDRIKFFLTNIRKPGKFYGFIVSFDARKWFSIVFTNGQGIFMMVFHG